MFEIDDPGRRTALLGRLGGTESRAFIDVDGRRVRGEPDPTRVNTSPLGKASAVQFLKFPIAPDAISRFRTPGRQIVVDFDPPNYAHMAVVTEPVSAALAQDFD
jgi:uncharacterized protein DUF3501